MIGLKELLEKLITTTRFLPNWFDPNHSASNVLSERPTSANITPDSRASVRHFIATSSTTAGKPKADANILHFSWDNANMYASQLAVLHSDKGLQYRYQRSGDPDDWNSWRDVYGDYTPATGLGRTYTSNTAVTQEQFNRIYAWKFGRLLVIQGNLNITSLPKSSAETTIGYINDTGTILFSGNVQVPCGTAGTANVSITQSGNNVRVGLYNYANTTASGWCRFNMVIILAQPT